MKKSLLFLLIPFSVFSQGKYGEFINSAIGDTLDINLVGESTKEAKYFISMHPSDVLIKDGGLLMPFDKAAELAETLKKAKAKYIEWVDVAKKNNVTDMNKEIKVEFPKTYGFFVYGDTWCVDYTPKPTAEFKIFKTESGVIEYLLIIRSGEMISNKNEFMKSKSLYTAFNSTAEIDAFISLLDPDSAKAYLEKNKALFKD